MSRRSLIPLCVFSIALALGVGWIVRIVAVEDPNADVAALAHPGTDARSVSNSSATTLIASGESIADSGSSGRSIAELPRRDSTASSPADQPALVDAVWVHGLVQLPSGTPADEHAEVIAEYRFTYSDLPRRAAIAADGRFFIDLPGAARRVSLRVEGRYLYSEESLELNLTNLPEQVLLQPTLGGCVHGRFVLPPHADASALEGALVELGRTGPRQDWSKPGRHDAVMVEKTLDFLIPRLPSEVSYSIRCRPNGFVAVELDNLSVKAGATATIEIGLELGARISGRVQDERGEPIEGAHFVAERKGAKPSPFRDRIDVQSAEDGTFDCAGLVPGELTLTASKEGCLAAKLEAGAMTEGAVRSDVVIVMSRGNSVKGRVQWPDGKPATSCAIDVHVPNPVTLDATEDWQYWEDRPAVTEDDGRFEITGLPKGPFTVTAHAVPEQAEETEPAADPIAAEAARTELANVEWNARSEGVEGNGPALLLVLQPGKTIEGRVVDDTGRPIERFRIEATPTFDSNDTSFAHERVSRSFHDAQGVFELRGLHDGGWRVSAQATGYALGSARECRVPGESRVPDIVLPRGSLLSGIVVDPEGKPVHGARLYLQRSRRGLGESAAAQSQPSTDEDGRFEWHDVAPGSFELVANAEHWANSTPLAVELTPGQRVEGLSLVLRQGGRLTGEALDSSGRPDANRLMVLSARGPFGSPRNFSTDASGRFDERNLVPGDYDVSLGLTTSEADDQRNSARTSSGRTWHHAAVRIVEGETAHVVLGAPPRSPVRVFGAVKVGPRSLPGARLSVGRRLSNGESISHETTSDGRGRYELTLEEPGDWGFFVTSAEGTSTGRHTEIPERPSHEFDLVLPSGTISGRVVDGGGQPISWLCVVLSNDGRTGELSSSAAGGWVTTDAGGRFRFEGLPAATYALQTEGSIQHPEDPPAYGRLHKGGLVLSEGSILGDIELRLGKPGVLQGVVLEPNGSPASGAEIVVRDDQGSIASPWGSVHTNSNGRFEATGLTPGRYTAFARTDNLCSSESGPVNVLADDSAHVDLTLQPSALLRVIVEDGHGKQVGAMISIVDARGRDFGPLNLAFEDEGEGENAGRKFGPLPPGSYDVAATNHDRAAVHANVQLGPGQEKPVTLRFGG